MKVRRRATETNAIQWNGNNVKDVVAFAAESAEVCVPWDDGTLSIQTADSTRLVRQGQWLLLDEHNNLLIYNPSAFRDDYEVVQ